MALTPPAESPPNETFDLDSARHAALTALRELAARRARLPAERARLLAAAWHAGERNVRELARIADVSRDTVYSDLKSMQIDPRDRSRPAEPLRVDAVRDLAEPASTIWGSAMQGQAVTGRKITAEMLAKACHVYWDAQTSILNCDAEQAMHLALIGVYPMIEAQVQEQTASEG